MKALQAAANLEKKRLAKEVRNEERKRKRLRERAKQLTEKISFKFFVFERSERPRGAKPRKEPPALLVITPRDLRRDAGESFLFCT